MKKIFTLFAALTMVLSVSAVNIPAGTKLYLTPNANWNKDNARFAAYFFGDGETWVSMTKLAGETNLYEVTSPAGKSPANVIFCRMNPGTSTNNWDNKWNQTSDLTYDGTLNHYTVKDGTWDKGGGTWSIWPLPAEKTYKDITITVVANATPKIYWWDAGDKLADSDWEARPDMVATATANTYAYTLKDVDETKGVNFIITVGDIQSADQHTTTDVTKNFKEFLPQVVVMGVNNWDGTDKMTVSDDYLSASITFSLDANKAYKLKLTVDGLWVGGDNVNITKDKNSALFAEDTGGDGEITTDLAGDYVFTYTYATKTLVVTYPVPTPTYDVTVADATVSTTDYSIDLAGTWEERTVTIKLWQDNVQGFGEYAANAETGYTCQLGNPYAELTPTTAGLYADNGDGIFTFTATMTDAEGGIYNISVTGAIPAAEIEWKEMPLEISNLTTMEMPVGDVTYLQLMGRNDMEDADVMLFLNNYTGEEKAYEVNAESSYMTFGGSELTVIDGSITKSVDPELGDVYAGIVHASVGEDGETMYVAFDLKMYALPSIAIELEDVEIVVNEESAIAFFHATWEGSPLQVEVSGFEEVEFKEYPECWLSIGDDVNWVDAAAGPTAVIIEDGVAMLEGEFTSFSTGKTYEVMLSSKLPQGPATGVDNVQVEVKTVKMIKNGQLIINRDGKSYNAQGATLK